MVTYFDARPEETGYYPTGDSVTVRFRENITEETVEEGTQWSADEYQVVLRCSLERAKARIKKSRDLFLRQAKELAKPQGGKLTVNDVADALVELGEMIAAQDDALVELAEMIGGE